MSDPALPRSPAPTVGASFAEAVIAALPGLALTGGIALLAFALRQIPGVGMFSPMILATVIGMLFHNLVGTPAICRAGRGLQPEEDPAAGASFCWAFS